MGRLIIILVCFVLTTSLSAQELNCQVTVSSQKIEGSERTIFENMQTAIYEFMNNRKWTNDVFSAEERIDCSILINITERVSSDVFKGTIQVQATRPVYNSAYNSTIVNLSDNDFQVQYAQFQPLQFSETNFVSNLTAILGYYAYLIIGMDYDSFSLEGGTPYFQKAQAIVSSAQGSNYSGWKAFESNKNRYWIVENILNQTFKPLRKVMYEYHINGFDIMASEVEKGRANIALALQPLRELYRLKPNNFSTQLFFQAKSDELVNLFSAAPQIEKGKIVDLLNLVDPGNASKYRKILN